MRPFPALGLLFAFLLPSLPACADAAIEGRVQLPKPHTAPVMNKRYEIVTRGGVVATDPPLAVVYLEGNFPAASIQPVAEISQHDYAFFPPLLPVRRGTKVEFPNHDETYHNIFSYSAAKRFDLGRYRPDEKPVPFQIFDKAGLVTLRCDIHEHMRGAILVLDTPYFVLSDMAGEYRLSGLPSGHYTLRAWVDSKTTFSREVDLKDGETVRLDLP